MVLIYNENYCKFCVDEGGNLYPREVVQKGVAEWLQMINPADTKGDFMKRADLYLQAMPEWAE